jgi:cytochrome c oxidase subunit II
VRTFSGVKVPRKPARLGWARSALWLPFVLVGCHPGHRQSVLHPASPEASQISTLWWVMFGVLTAVFIVVMALTAAAVLVRRRQDAAPPGGGVRFVVVSGIVIPSVILVALLFYSLQVTISLRRPQEGLLIQVTGHRWWWDVRYPELGIVTANEIYIPAGKPVLLELKSADVVHSFWVPNLHGKMDALPEVVNRFWIRSDEPGTWRGQCAEFCGRQHALMAFEVVALPPEEFEAWVAERRQPHPEPEDPRLVQGRDVFFQASCNNCHAIRGTGADGLTGPDLTHIGTRLTLGAGTIPNNTANLAGWLVNPQAIKPGNEMPRTFIDADDLHALVDYLQTLK